jgi:hypothetical protein
MPTTTSRGRPTVTTPIDRAEINRRNSKRSTGPRTPEGRARSRFNAVKHGCRARLPILPGEDPQVYQDRLETWVDRFGPRDAVEHYLVERAVDVSWQLDRANRAEAAALVAEFGREADGRAEEVRELGAELFAIPPGPIGREHVALGEAERTLLSWPFEPEHSDHPTRQVAALEATAAGCDWLRAQWAELGAILDAGRKWRPFDRVRAIRLLGKQPLDVVADDQVLTIYLAGHAMDAEGPDVFAEPLGDLLRPETAASRERQMARFAAARAERGFRDAAEARAALRALVAAGLARAEALRGVRAADEAAGRADIAARLSYEATVTVDWLHKRQVSCTRALYRAFEELRKLRRDFAADRAADEPAVEPPAKDSPPGPCEDTGAPRRPSSDPRENTPEASVPEGSVAGFVGRVEPTECPAFAPVGFTDPIAVQPASWNRLETEAGAAREADELGALHRSEFVAPDDLPPTASEPAAVEPVADREAQSVTNEAISPADPLGLGAAVPAREVAVGPASPTESEPSDPDRPGPPDEGAGLPTSMPADEGEWEISGDTPCEAGLDSSVPGSIAPSNCSEPGDLDATNEASEPARAADPPVSTLSAPLLALSALLLCAGFAASFADLLDGNARDAVPHLDRPQDKTPKRPGLERLAPDLRVSVGGAVRSLSCPDTHRMQSGDWPPQSSVRGTEPRRVGVRKRDLKSRIHPVSGGIPSSPGGGNVKVCAGRPARQVEARAVNEWPTPTRPPLTVPPGECVRLTTIPDPCIAGRPRMSSRLRRRTSPRSTASGNVVGAGKRLFSWSS